MNFLVKMVTYLSEKVREQKMFEKIKDYPETFLLNAPKKTEDVFLDVYILGGTVIEEQSKSGIGHLLEHYLLEKTSKEFGSEIKINGNIAKERTIIYAKIEKNKLAEDLAQQFLIHTLK